MSAFRAGVFSLLVLSSVFTVSVGLYMAQPWSDNYAYETSDAYVTLAGFLLFAVTPNVALLLFSKIFPPGSKALNVFLVGASVIAAFGVYAYVDAAFLHLDAQGGLVFIFLPTYQWLAAVVLTIVCLAIERLSGMRDHDAQQGRARDVRNARA